MKTAVLIITYNPDITILDKVIRSIVHQVTDLFIIDNNSLNKSTILNYNGKNIKVFLNSSNLGIAKATNIGFEKILNDDYEYVLLSDQDTIYPDDYISIFMNEVNKNFKDRLENIVAFAPNIYDVNSKQYKHSYILEKNRLINFYPKENCRIFQAIASGLIINTEILKKIGGMNEDLFIDYVDFEWCWKANYEGYEIFFLKDLKINHSLGDSTKKLFGKNVSKRNRVRYYYIVRNTYYLSLYTEYLTNKAKFFLKMKVFKYFVGYIIMSKGTDVFLLIKALIDGKKKNLGILK